MVLVFDLGGTKVRIGLSDKGELVNVVRYPTDRTSSGFAKFLGQLQELAAGQTISAVVGGIPGQLDEATGELNLATHLPDWLGLPVVGQIRELFDCPVVIHNDVEMCGMGEAHYGAGKSDGVMVYVTVSTGVNAVRLIAGEVDRSIGRFELGKQVLVINEARTQSLESLVGGAALEQRLGKAPRDIIDYDVWAQVEAYLAAAVFNMMLYWNPATIVFGGSMMRDISLRDVSRRLREFPQPFGAWPKLAGAALADEGGLRGAVYLAVELGYH